MALRCGRGVGVGSHSLVIVRFEAHDISEVLELSVTL